MGVPQQCFCRDYATGAGAEVLDAFEKAVAAYSDVLEMSSEAGAADYLLKVVPRKHRDFARIIRKHLAAVARRRQMHQFAFTHRVHTTAAGRLTQQAERDIRCPQTRDSADVTQPRARSHSENACTAHINSDNR